MLAPDAMSVPNLTVAGDSVLARLERIPVSWWHLRARIILGFATFFDAYDLLALTFALPAFVQTWHMSPQQVGFVISSAFAGQFVGALVSGWLAERYGRLFVTNITVAIFSVMSIACALAWDPQSLMAFRFIQGIGLGGEVPIATAYITELARAQGRGRFYISYELVFIVGLVAAGFLGVWMVPALGWQSMFYLGAAPGVLVFFLRRLLPESPRWLISKGRIAEADAAVTAIERFVVERGTILPPPRPTARAATPDVTRWGELFEGRYLRRTLTVWVMWFCCFSTSYGLFSWLPTLYRTVFNLPLAQSLNYGLITQVAGLAGATVCAFTIDRVGRRVWFTTGLLTGGVLMFIVWALSPTTPTVLLVLVSLGSLFLSGVSIGLNLYTPELYPTRIRAAGTSVGGSWQRVAAFLGPIVVGYLVPGYGLGSVFLYFGGLALLGGIVTLIFAIETKDQVLEELSP